jgi:predicted RNA-binding protein with PIN domain
MGAIAKYLVVDGHSVIFQWPELRSLHASKQSAARDSLIRTLQNLHDISHWRVTLVLDGKLGSAPRSREKPKPTDMVTIYGNTHQTADSIIERLVALSGQAPAITVITADEAERRLVEALGAYCASPDWLRGELEVAGACFASEFTRVKKAANWR